MDFVSPNGHRQAKFDKNVKNTGAPDQSMGRHQGELENMLSMLSKFE